MHPRFKFVPKQDYAVDFTEWGLPKVEAAIEGITANWGQLVRDAAAEVIEYALENHASAFFPAAYGPECDGFGNPPVTDAAVLYVHLPFGPGEHQEPCWSISLADVVGEAIVSEQEPNTGYIPPPYRQNLSAIAAMLREQAARIDAALAIPEPTDTPHQTPART